MKMKSIKNEIKLQYLIVGCNIYELMEIQEKIRKHTIAKRYNTTVTAL